jgi:hypothetical protein
MSSTSSEPKLARRPSPTPRAAADGGSSGRSRWL